MGDEFKKGEWNVCCDDCGFEFKASQLKPNWRRAMVCFGVGTNGCWEPRHPQELTRGKKDRQAVPWARHCAAQLLPQADSDALVIDKSVSLSGSFDVLSNDTYGTLATITWLNIPDASTEGAITYTDASSTEQTVVAGTAITAADYNSPTFTATSDAPALLTNYFYEIKDSLGQTARSWLSVSTINEVASAATNYSVGVIIDYSGSSAVLNQSVFDGLGTLLDELLQHLAATSGTHDLYVAFATSTNILDPINTATTAQVFTETGITDYTAARAHVNSLDATGGSGVAVLAAGVKGLNDWFDTVSGTPVTYTFGFSLATGFSGEGTSDLTEWTGKGGHRFVYGLSGPAPAIFAAYDNTAGDGTPDGTALTPDASNSDQLVDAFETIET